MGTPVFHLRRLGQEFVLNRCSRGGRPKLFSRYQGDSGLILDGLHGLVRLVCVVVGGGNAWEHTMGVSEAM